MRDRKRWQDLRNTLLGLGVKVEEKETKSRGHAELLAAQGGFELVLAVGGDGTVSEVAAGMLRAKLTDTGAIIGVMPLGSGNDFSRTAQELVSGGELAMRLAFAEPVVMDAGHIRFESTQYPDRYFVNVANVGFSAAVGDRVEQSLRWLPRAAGYLLGVLSTLVGYKNPWVEMELDGEKRSCCANSVVIALGKYFGQGMKIAPNAVVGDGHFEVILLGDIGKIDLVASYPRLYTGSHIHHRKVDVLRGRCLTIQANQHLTVESDGDTRGHLPATFEVLSGAIRVIA